MNLLKQRSLVVILISLTGCSNIICSHPLTLTPVGSPCGCVFPMQVVLDLGMALRTLFPRIAELETEIAAGTYLKQSQVNIVGANAEGQDQEKTRVHINLVPFRNKFTKTTALFISKRFWRKQVPINWTLFGEYDVICVHYPGKHSIIIPIIPFLLFLLMFYVLVLLLYAILRSSFLSPVT